MQVSRLSEHRWAILAAILVAAVFVSDPGEFVRVAARSPLTGPVCVELAIFGLVAVAALVLLPLAVYVAYCARKAARETQRDLARLAKRYPHFAWNRIERRVREALRELYAAWSKGDLAPAAQYLTRDYRESHQDLLERWAEEGKRNHVSLEKVRTVRPLRVVVANEEQASHVSVFLRLEVVDYLEETSTGKVLKGRREGSPWFETVWHLVDEDGCWRLAAVEPGTEELTIAKQPNFVDTSFLDRRARSKPALSQPAKRDPATQIEGARTGVADRQYYP